VAVQPVFCSRFFPSQQAPCPSRFEDCCGVAGMQAAGSNENISPKAMKAIMLEIRDLTKTPIDGVRVVMNED
jgi:hypothetical protein